MRRAAALPMVLMALGLVGALTVGGAFVVRRFVDDARVDNRALALRPAAERAIVVALTNLDSAALVSLAPGSTLTAVEVTQSVVTSVWSTVLGPTSAWVVAEAVAADKPLLRKRLGAIGAFAGGHPGHWTAVTWLELP